MPSVKGEQRGEREMIEAALAESRNRVSGPSGAAAKLRIPPSTLESTIRAPKNLQEGIQIRLIAGSSLLTRLSEDGEIRGIREAQTLP